MTSPIGPEAVERLRTDFLAALRRAGDIAEELRAAEFEGTADDERISATVGAMGALVSVRIGTMAKRQLDHYTLSEQVLLAIQRATAEADEHRSQALRSLTVGGVPVEEIMARPQAGINTPTAER